MHPALPKPRATRHTAVRKSDAKAAVRRMASRQEREVKRREEQQRLATGQVPPETP
jgi:hypothetical protein